jgi:hypothetical protein
MSEVEEVESAARETANAVKSTVEAYQAKLIDIAKENMQFAFDFGQALVAVKTPVEFADVTTQYSKRQFDMFQEQTRELMALTRSQASTVTNSERLNP